MHILFMCKIRSKQQITLPTNFWDKNILSLLSQITRNLIQPADTYSLYEASTTSAYLLFAINSKPYPNFAAMSYTCFSC